MAVAASIHSMAIPMLSASFSEVVGVNILGGHAHHQCDTGYAPTVPSLHCIAENVHNPATAECLGMDSCWVLWDKLQQRQEMSFGVSNRREAGI